MISVIHFFTRIICGKIMSEHVDFPFSAEYAKSNRAGCKSCGDNIAKDSLRLAVMVQVKLVVLERFKQCV